MKNTPKLRFKEFSGDWEIKKLGDLLEFKNGINASKEQYGHGKKFINVLDILNNDYITYENIVGKVDVDEATFERYSVGYGDVVFQRSSETREEVGTANIYLDKEQSATFGGFIIRGKKVGEYDPIFMNKLLKTSSARKEITTKSGGSTRYNVGQETLSDVEIMFPTVEEQEKIASLFYLIDNKIYLQREKVEAIKDYKKGMMQKIFNRELRFKDEDGKDYPEWEDRAFEELYLSIPTKSHQIKSSEVKSNGEFEVVDQGKEIVCGYSDNKEKVFYNVPAIIYGDHTTNVKFRTEKFVIGADGTKLLINKNNSNDLKFLFFALEFNNIEPEGYKRHFSIVKQINLSIPSSKKEQTMVSRLLSSVDRKITKEKDKLEYLTEYKKGLLQQMFV